MSRLTKTPPLINLHPTPLGPVQVHFNEPFLQQQGSRKTRAVLQLLALLSCLELVLAKKSSLEEVRMIDDLSKAMLKKLTKEENALKAQLETVWIQLDSKDLLYRRTMMHDMKLRELFPRAANETGGTFVQSSDATDISAHYRRVAQYDQLYASAARLYHSLSLDDHKYIPYRLAIVYQCLAPLDKPFADHRARIQECFELINSHIIDQEQKNKDEPPRLTKEQTTMCVLGKEESEGKGWIQSHPLIHDSSIDWRSC
ncbi:hypothetical protein BX666DRAFT_1968767 [Dichotomocladium elegans]|nr:hypothetical protein BX666DRAFT_1968767 [Dichotomocladium elegans]